MILHATSFTRATQERPAGRSASRSVAVAAIILLFAVARPSEAVPSYARQTGMTCQACHTVFPELTPFGRLFKLNGYQIDNLPQVQGITPSRDPTLLLNEIPPLSFMFQGALTRTGRPLSDSNVAGARAQNGQVLFPQQASLFYAGRVAPNVGAFVQITYDGSSGTIGWDNTDIRYARQHGGVDGVTYGLSINNNPTVQDVWNSTPAWQTPFDQQTSGAPTPGATTEIDGALADRGVVGLTTYVWLKKSLYGEVGVYRSSPQGFAVNDLAGPLDSTAGGVISGAAPYWRIADERQWGKQSLSVGTYGMVTRLTGADQPIGPPLDRFRDIAVDGQYQFIGDSHIVSVQSTFIAEHQTLDSSVALGLAANPTDTLHTFRAGTSYYYQRKYGGAFGVFSTSGTSDALLYQPAATFGFGNNSPNSNGWIGELDYLPWQNVKLLLQYVDYHTFNGASAAYDGNGRNAGDNNTLYILGWFAF